MRITEQEQELRRERMLRVAYDLFGKYGIDRVSLARIAKEANVSSKSIFRYFDSKTSLIQQTQDILWREIVDYIFKSNLQAVSETENGLEELRVQLYGFDNLYKNHSNYILFAYDYKAYLIRNKLKMPSGMKDKTIQMVSPLFLNSLQRGQADGSITEKQPAEVLFLKIWYTMRHFVEQMVVYDYIHYDKNSWEDFFSFMVNNILNYVKVKTS